jgi:RNA polymerase-interacting CarD/CdnL/TRCF family regulator
MPARKESIKSKLKKGDSMDQNASPYSVGQWVVHCQYGVGQIKQIESVPLGGNFEETEKCFTVQTRNGTFWFPVEQNENPRVRPITSEKKFKKALKALQEPPQDTDAHHNVIKGRINSAKKDTSLKTTVELVRDLSARNNIKKLNILEQRALKLHTDRVVREWSLCMKLDENEATTRLNKILQQELETEKG